ncbi:MAG: hypothetical protein HYY17_01385 [Planctomycetes bacterium]|nr:hypothetical protein [Planctomycetota bacterium]
MEDADFPSGPWTGYYVYDLDGKRERMDLDLRFADGLVSGSGTDPVGFFLVRGRYDAKEAEVWWHKTYPGRHDVYYRGFREGRGIWGTWQIHEWWRGGFKIWPKGIGEGAVEKLEVEEPVEAHAAAPTRPGTHIEEGL